MIILTRIFSLFLKTWKSRGKKLRDYFDENLLLPLLNGLPVCERSKWPTLKLYTSGHSLTKKWDAIRIEVIWNLTRQREREREKGRRGDIVLTNSSSDKKVFPGASTSSVRRTRVSSWIVIFPWNCLLFFQFSLGFLSQCNLCWWGGKGVSPGFSRRLMTPGDKACWWLLSIYTPHISRHIKSH